MTDVVMKEAAPAATETAHGAESGSLLIADLRKNLLLIEKSVSTKEQRFLSRVLRQTTSVRRRLTRRVLVQLINLTFTENSNSNSAATAPSTSSSSSSSTSSSLQSQKAILLSYVETVSSDMDIEPTASSSSAPAPSGGASAAGDSAKATFPNAHAIEVEMYVALLVVMFLIDHKKHEEAAKLSALLVERAAPHTRPSLNLLSAKIFFFYSWSHELVGRASSLRPALLAAHRTASLRHNDEAVATILNLLLRNYLENNLYDQADKLVSKTTLHEQSCSTNQYARYLYYQGRIKAIQLDYTEAYNFLLQATRKAPQAQGVAKGFRQTVHKFLCIVQLLLGEMPDIGIFRQPSLKRALRPYLELTQAVRVGDLGTFRGVVERFGNAFHKDHTYTLIQRLRHNVIKTGLRKINLSYSRISIQDICAKLKLECDQEDAEHIVAKAIKDGVIDATIDHAGGFIESRENTDIYSTTEPHGAFHTRVRFCLDVHNDAVRAMRFPEDQHRRLAADQAENARKERALTDEIVKELDEDDGDEF